MASEKPLEGRCGARVKNAPGLYCTSYPAKGATRCRMHGGNAPQVRAKAKRNIALEEAHRLARRAGEGAHPIEHLLDSLYRAAAEVEVYGRMVAELDNAGEVELADKPGELRGWAERRLELVAMVKSDGSLSESVVEKLHKDPLLVQAGDGRVKLHPFVDLYERALERRAKFAKLALDAGVAEREVQVKEREAAEIAGLVRRILTRLGVQNSRETIRIVQSEMRALADRREEE